MTEPTPQPAAATPGAPLTEAEDRQWASFAHLGGIIGFLPSLIIWLVFKDRGRFTNTEAKEALNFQLTCLGLYIVINILAAIVGAITFGIGGLLIILVWVVAILSIVLSIMGFLKAKDGIAYRYPFAIRLIK
ncbi:DUF4870 domain-containing protein [Galbitalea soli]|uniref:DUF4870 domain-containing protein n=1 Tax=Galbitalea soli TaxID=1268042 RepID=A0A7C9TNQ4_9MICO|nr:DUF4870 domain-containing protein [Galbitalea soli]NEM89841.1 DUF4870 domain-containing protein [Galbitalea soli]NYJ30545.1 hypothetical protein [Galbitalea soli]